MPASNFYPSIKSLVSTKSIPVLDWIPDSSIDSLLDSIFYKNLEIYKDEINNAVTYRLSLVSNKDIGISFPGIKDFRLSLNSGSGSTSVFDIELYFQWQFLLYCKKLFKLKSFDWSPQSISNLFFDFFNLTKEDLLSATILSVVEGDELDSDPFEVFVALFNTVNPTNQITYNYFNTAKETTTDIFSQILTQNIDLNSFVIDEIIGNDIGNFYKKIGKLVSKKISADNIEDKLKEILTPRFSFELKEISLSLSFPDTILLPIDEDNVVIPNEKSKLTFNAGQLKISSDKGFEFKNLSTFDFHKSLIVNTGFFLSATGVKVDLSNKKNIPEADADGRPVDFIGCYIADGTIGFPLNWGHNPTGSTGSIKARNLLIGTGGISGTLALEANVGVTVAPIVQVNFGGFSVSLDQFSITFQQNSIVSSTIKGTLKIPGFKDSTDHDAIINIDIFIGTHGDFSITASEDSGIDALVIPNVLKIRLKSLSFGQKNNRFYTSISGFVDIIAGGAGDLNIEGLPKNIEVKKLLIWEDGKLEIEGGALTLPKALAIKIGPVKLSLSAIHLGSEIQKHGSIDRKFNYFGFDGGVSVKPGGVDVQGSGVKFYYTTDDDPNPVSPNPVKNSIKFLRIESIKIDIRIPGDAKEDKDTTLMLSGMLGMKNGEPVEGGADPSTEYIGSVLFKANKLSVAGSVGMRLNPDIPAFLIDAEIDFGDNGILLGSTGLGLYGLRGLVGQKYGLDKGEDEDYWQLYKKPTEGINIEKFKQKDGFALGVGATLGTYNDQGKAFSTKVFLMLGLPDVFLIQGQAAIMAEKRIQLGDTNDPPYSALISINKEAFRATLGANIKKPESGKIMRIEGKIDMAFFFNNPGGWYINIGKDSPDSERIKARIFDLFDAYAYLMINKQGIKLGAGASIEQKRGFGPVKLEMGATLDIKGQISFKPLQLGGSIDLAGYARLKVFKFQTSIVAGAGLAADVSHPFAISGYLYIHIKTPKFIDDIDIDVDFNWIFDTDKDREPIKILNISDERVPAKAVNMHTEEQFKIKAFDSSSATIPAPTDSAWGDLDDYIIPMDSFIDIDLEYSVIDNTAATDGGIKILGQVTGSENIVLVPPQKGLLSQIKHTMAINKLKIKYWDSGTSSWLPYDPYDSVPNIKLIPEVISKLPGNPPFLQTLPVANWQLNEPGKNSKIRVLALNPLSHFSKASKGMHTLEYMGFTEGIITCKETRKKGFELEWVGEHGLSYQTETYYGKKGFSIISKSIPASVENRTPVDSVYTTALRIDAGNTVIIQLPEACNKVVPHIEADSTATVTISYFELLSDNTNSPADLPIEAYNLVQTDNIAAADLDDYGQTGGYEDEVRKISKLEICINASSVTGSTGTGGVLAANTGNLFIGGDGSFTIGNCKGITLDNLVILNDSVVAGSVKNTIQYPHPVTSGNEVANYEMDNSPNDSSSNGLDGSYMGINNPRSAPGYSGVTGEALTFCYGAMEVPHDTRLNLNGSQFLIGVWFNSAFGCAVPNKDFVIMEKKSSGGSYRLSGSFDNIAFTESLMFELKEGYGTTNNVLQLKYSGPTKAASGVNIKYVDNNWHYISVYCDKAAKKLELYIDGNLLNAKNYSKFDTMNTGFALTDAAWVYSIEAESEKTYSYNKTIPSQEQLISQNTKIKDAMESAIQPIWRPDTTFAIQAELVDTVVDDNGSNNGSGTALPSEPQFYNFGFRTKGTIGHFHTYRAEYEALVEQKREDEFMLATFKPYINYDRSYPNADGNLLNAKPLFYESPKLSLFFTEPYVYNMFGTWELGSTSDVETGMTLMVNDPESLLQNADALEGQWVQKNNMTATGQDARILQNLIVNMDNEPGEPKCTLVLPPNFKRVNFSAEYEIPDLKPSKLYTAVYSTLLGTNKAQVLNHSFNTSRYPNFEAQIGSFILYNENSILKKAVFELNIALTSGEVTTAIETLTNPQNNPDALKVAYIDVFERLISGVLKLSNMEAATTTEVNAVINETSGKILGFLVRNPEPFIDPKIKVVDLDNSNQPIGTQCAQGSTTITSFVNVYKKDRGSIFVSNSNMDMPLGNYTLTFKNLGWDGAVYAAIGDAETITFTL